MYEVFIKMNLGDPDLELIDPTPNVHALFISFDKLFFWTKLGSRAVVRWSKRMYSCAGICSYEGRNGLCDIALSEPLLKLRPRKDLIETLLHEMIHAFLFVTNRDQDRDGHGPNFLAHMHRINKFAGLNISVYHTFHDEVKLYQTHWWRCNGPCQTRKPHFGIVRRSANRAPGPNDFWWQDHKSKCGGTFIKIKEPEKKQKAKGKKEVAKPNQDITKYINNNNVPFKKPAPAPKSILKDVNSQTNKPILQPKNNGANTIVVSKKGVAFNPTLPKPFLKPSQPIVPSVVKSVNTLGTGKSPNKSSDVIETVRNVWATKQIPVVINNNQTAETVRNIWAKKQIPGIVKQESVKTVETSPVAKNPVNNIRINSPINKSGVSNPNKHKAEPTDLKSPPAKMKKINDYFNATTILKDVYGDDYKLTQDSNSSKLIAVKVQLVDCPICNAKFSSEEINRHLDECLNKEVIEELCNDSLDSNQAISPIQSNVGGSNLKQLVGDIPTIPAFTGKSNTINNNIDLTNVYDYNSDNIKNENKESRKSETPESLNPEYTNLIKSLVDKMDDQNKPEGNTTSYIKTEKSPIKRRNTVSFITETRGDSLLDRNKVKAEVKSEPGTSTEKDEVFGQTCPCCGNKFDKPVEEHLDECLVFFDNNATMPEEGPSTSYSNNTTIVIDDDDDDIFDETQILNATGTKTPCPCCMEMVELSDMNEHLDNCLK